MKQKQVICSTLILVLISGLATNHLFAQNAGTQPVALLAGKKSGTITKEELTKAVKIECTGDAFIVTEFRLMVIEKNSKKEFYSKNEKLTPEMISAFQDVSVGTKIYIEFILAKPEKGEGARQISPLEFTVSE